MRVGVTAATGELGSRLCRELADQIGPDNVVAIAREPDRLRLECETRQGDYLRAADWPEALSGTDTVILVSSPVGPWDRVAMHRAVIAGAQRAGVRKILYTSVIGNGREATTRYAPVAAINRQAEEDIRTSGLAWAVPRNGLYLEYDVAHIVNAGDVFRNNGGDGRCGYITRDELAFAIARMALNDDCNGQIFNLVADCRTQAELVAMVNEAFGLKVRYEAVSDEEVYARLAPVRGEQVADMLTGCYQCIRNGAFDVDSDFERAAGRAPLSIREQIRRLAVRA